MTLAILVWGGVAVWLAMACVMTLAWGIALKSGNAGWIDVCWTFGLGLIGVAVSAVPVISMAPAAAALSMSGAGVPANGLDLSPHAALCGTLIGAWALRLGLHIAHRSHRHGDDPRYAQLRKDWGADYRRRLFLFLQIQALAGVPLLLAVLICAHRPQGGLDIRDTAAVLICVLAISGEAAADRTLRQFARLPKRRDAVCDIGLWRWSRHPNYFFEWLYWLAWPVLSYSLGDNPWAFATFAAPAFMYLLLVHVSGIPPLEAHMARSRGEAWRIYAARTPAFFPRRPREPRAPR